MSKFRCETELDAYGHLEWTVGHEDWIACFDAIRVREGIAYHVVVDCESGGFTDTIEGGIVSVDEAVAQLGRLPWQYADVCVEHYIDSADPEHRLDVAEVERCAESWQAHLEAIAARSTPEEEEDESDGYAELRKAALNHRGQP